MAQTLKWHYFQVLRYNSLSRVLHDTEAYGLSKEGFYYDARCSDIICTGCDCVLHGSSRADHLLLNPTCQLITISLQSLTFDLGLASLKRDQHDDRTLLDSRMKTFANWPNADVDPKKIAESGFVYCGRDDLCRCTSCHRYSNKWTVDTIVIDQHFPYCRLRAKLLAPPAIDILMCSHCFGHQATHASLPCGHLSHCKFCAQKIQMCSVCKMHSLFNIDVTQY